MQYPSNSPSRCLLAALSGMVSLASGQDGTLAREYNASIPPGTEGVHAFFCSMLLG